MKKPASKHFRMEEFASPIYKTDAQGRYVRNARGRVIRVGSEPVPERLWGNLQRLMDALDVIREAWGKPLSITPAGGWRSQHANKANKGRATRSQHLKARAADLRCTARDAPRLYALIKQLRAEEKIPKGGLSRYPYFVHYDIRGFNVGW